MSQTADLGIRLSIKDDTRSGVDSVKKTLNGIQGEVGAGKTGSSAIPSPIMKSLQTQMVFQTKILKSIDDTLKSIQKNSSQLPQLGGGGGGGMPSIPGGGKGINFKGIMGGKFDFGSMFGGGSGGAGASGMGGIGGILTKLGVVGAIAGGVALAVKTSYNFMEKASSGVRSATSAQTPDVLGLQTFRGERGGIFDVDKKNMILSTERAKYYSTLEKMGGAGNFSFMNGGGDVGNRLIKGEIDRLKIAEGQMGTLYGAFGVAPELQAQSMAMNIQGRSSKSYYKTRTPFEIAQSAQLAGFGGAKTGEFFEAINSQMGTMQSLGLNVKSSKSSEQLITALGGVEASERTRQIGLREAQNLQGIAGGASSLRGGAGSAFALQALMTQGGMKFGEARTTLGRGMDERTLGMVISQTEKYSGGDTEKRNLMLRNMGYFGDVNSDEVLNEVINNLKDNLAKGITTDSGTGTSFEQKGMTKEEIAKKAEQAQKEIFSRGDRSEQISKELGSLNNASQKLADGFNTMNSVVAETTRRIGDFRFPWQKKENKTK